MRGAARWHMGSRVQLSKMGSPRQLYDGSPRCTYECGKAVAANAFSMNQPAGCEVAALASPEKLRLPPFAQFAAGSRPCLRMGNKTARHAKSHGLAVSDNVAEQLSLRTPCIKRRAAARHAQR